MIRTSRAPVVGVLLLSAAMLVAACGGATSTDDPTDATPEPTPVGEVPIGELPSFDPAQILANLDGVDSYKITMATDGEVGYSATVVTKPELSRDIVMGEGTDAQHIIVVGDKAWMEEGGTFTELPSGMLGGLLAAFDPMLFAGAFAQPGAWSGAQSQGTEDRNGVQAEHFQIDASSMVGSVAGMPAGASVDAWVATDGGYIVALEIKGEDGDGIVIDVSDVNDPSNQVQAPA